MELDGVIFGEGSRVPHLAHRDKYVYLSKMCFEVFGIGGMVSGMHLGNGYGFYGGDMGEKKDKQRKKKDGQKVLESYFILV